MTARVAVPLICLLVYLAVIAFSDPILPTDPAAVSNVIGAAEDR